MSEIPTRTPGRTGFETTVLGYGAMEFRNNGPMAPKVTNSEAEQLLNQVLDSGINLIDTSIDYGMSEELIGRYISHRRQEYFLASKCGCVPGIPTIHIRGGAARGTPTDWENRWYYMLEKETLKSRWHKAGLDDLLGGMSRMEFTVRFTLSHPDLDTTIIGTSNPEHLRENIGFAIKGTLPEDLLVEARRRLDRAGSRPEPTP